MVLWFTVNWTFQVMEAMPLLTKVAGSIHGNYMRKMTIDSAAIYKMLKHPRLDNVLSKHG